MHTDDVLRRLAEQLDLLRLRLERRLFRGGLVRARLGARKPALVLARGGFRGGDVFVRELVEAHLDGKKLLEVVDLILPLLGLLGELLLLLGRARDLRLGLSERPSAYERDARRADGRRS